MGNKERTRLFILGMVFIGIQSLLFWLSLDFAQVFIGSFLAVGLVVILYFMVDHRSHKKKP